MKKYLIEFEIEGLPKLGNEILRGSWRVRHGHARQWKKRVWAHCAHLRPDTPLIKAQLCLTRVSSRECDFDGLVSSFKHCIDALVEIGILADDKPSNIGQSTYLWKKGKIREGKIIMRIEEI